VPPRRRHRRYADPGTVRCVTSSILCRSSLPGPLRARARDLVAAVHEVGPPLFLDRVVDAVEPALGQPRSRGRSRGGLGRDGSVLTPGPDRDSLDQGTRLRVRRLAPPSRRRTRADDYEVVVAQRSHVRSRPPDPNARPSQTPPHPVSTTRSGAEPSFSPKNWMGVHREWRVCGQA